MNMNHHGKDAIYEYNTLTLRHKMHLHTCKSCIIVKQLCI